MRKSRLLALFGVWMGLVGAQGCGSAVEDPGEAREIRGQLSVPGKVEPGATSLRRCWKYHEHSFSWCLGECFDEDSNHMTDLFIVGTSDDIPYGKCENAVRDACKNWFRNATFASACWGYGR